MKVPLVYSLIGIHLSISLSADAAPQPSSLNNLPGELILTIAENIRGDNSDYHIRDLHEFALVSRKMESISRPLRYEVLRAQLKSLNSLTKFHKQAMLQYTKSLEVKDNMTQKMFLSKYRESLLAILKNTGTRETCILL